MPRVDLQNVFEDREQALQEFGRVDLLSDHVQNDARNRLSPRHRPHATATEPRSTAPSDAIRFPSRKNAGARPSQRASCLEVPVFRVDHVHQVLEKLDGVPMDDAAAHAVECSEHPGEHCARRGPDTALPPHPMASRRPRQGRRRPCGGVGATSGRTRLANADVGRWLCQRLGRRHQFVCLPLRVCANGPPVRHGGSIRMEDESHAGKRRRCGRRRRGRTRSSSSLPLPSCATTPSTNASARAGNSSGWCRVGWWRACMTSYKTTPSWSLTCLYG